MRQDVLTWFKRVDAQCKEHGCSINDILTCIIQTDIAEWVGELPRSTLLPVRAESLRVDDDQILLAMRKPDEQILNTSDFFEVRWDLSDLPFTSPHFSHPRNEMFKISYVFSADQSPQKASWSRVRKALLNMGKLDFPIITATSGGQRITVGCFSEEDAVLLSLMLTELKDTKGFPDA